MEKLYKFKSATKLQKLFAEYGKDNFSKKAYLFISKYLAGKSISNIDVYQLCDMFTELSFFEVFGEQYTTWARAIELRHAFNKAKSNANCNLRLLDKEKNTYITWHTESAKEMYDMDRNN